MSVKDRQSRVGHSSDVVQGWPCCFIGRHVSVSRSQNSDALQTGQALQGGEAISVHRRKVPWSQATGGSTGPLGNP